MRISYTSLDKILSIIMVSHPVSCEGLRRNSHDAQDQQSFLSVAMTIFLSLLTMLTPLSNKCYINSCSVSLYYGFGKRLLNQDNCVILFHYRLYFMLKNPTYRMLDLQDILSKLQKTKVFSAPLNSPASLLISVSKWY